MEEREGNGITQDHISQPWGARATKDLQGEVKLEYLKVALE